MASFVLVAGRLTDSDSDRDICAQVLLTQVRPASASAAAAVAFFRYFCALFRWLQDQLTAALYLGRVCVWAARPCTVYLPVPVSRCQLVTGEDKNNAYRIAPGLSCCCNLNRTHSGPEPNRRSRCSELGTRRNGKNTVGCWASSSEDFVWPCCDSRRGPV